MNISELKINIKEIKYGFNKIILQNISLQINQPGLYGVFGKNGQGKSTFLHAIAGLKTYQGEIYFNSKEIESHQIGFIATEPQVYEYLTAKEFYKFYSRVSRGKNTISTDRIFSIDENVYLKSMSTGTLKKAYINSVLQFKDYNIYIFDEPFNGLDIESNYILLNLINNLAKEHIVFVSSHILEIVQPYLKKSYLVNNQTITEVKENEIQHLLLASK